MNFLLERQNRQHLWFLSGICILFLFSALLNGYMGLAGARLLLLQRESQLASALIDEGVSKETLAAVFSDSPVTEEGSAFLGQIGHSAHTPLWLFPSVGDRIPGVLLSAFLGALFLCVVLLAGTIVHMKRRELLYQDAVELVERFAKGDFSGQLPWEHTGTLYRLFSSTDQLARALQARCETERSLGEFLKNTISDISHQLKTPLAALRMYTEIIEAEPDHSDTVQRFAQKSMLSLNRMEGLISSLLKMMRLDTGTVQFDLRPYPVREVVLYAMEELSVRAVQENKNISCEGDPDETLLCDLTWLGEAVANLIKNALDHTEEGGNIHIAWEHSPILIRLSVSDDGEGIAPEDIHHIFKRFYQSSHASSDHQGVGLGLSLARAIVEGHGGSLSVTSSPGRGSVFVISFCLTES